MSDVVFVWECETPGERTVAFSLLRGAEIPVLFEDGKPQGEIMGPPKFWVAPEHADDAKELLDRAFDDDPET